MQKAMREGLTLCVVFLVVVAQASEDIMLSILSKYPTHIRAHYVFPHSIDIDGRVTSADGGEKAWSKADWVTLKQDISAPMFVDGSKTYAPPSPFYDTKVAVLWDDDYLYIAAILNEPSPRSANVTGENPTLSNVPYQDNDFEVFINPSSSSHYFIEIETNANAAIYDVLWRVSSENKYAVPCNLTDGATLWCANTSSHYYPGNWSMVQANADNDQRKNYHETKREGGGMLIASRNISTEYTLQVPGGQTQGHYTPWNVSAFVVYPDEVSTQKDNLVEEEALHNQNGNAGSTQGYNSWSIEMRLPLREGDGYSSLLSTGRDENPFPSNLDPKVYYGLTKGGEWIAENRSRPLYWLANWARAEHIMQLDRKSKGVAVPYRGDNQTTNWCESSMRDLATQTILGTDQYSCYWEWVLQPLGWTRYMHFPQYFSQLEFVRPYDDLWKEHVQRSSETSSSSFRKTLSPTSTSPSSFCANVEWPGRYIARQLFFAQLTHFHNTGRFVSSSSSSSLSSSSWFEPLLSSCLNGTEAQICNSHRGVADPKCVSANSFGTGLCDFSALSFALAGHERHDEEDEKISIPRAFGITIHVYNEITRPCPNYDTGKPSGGMCFEANVTVFRNDRQYCGGCNGESSNDERFFPNPWYTVTVREDKFVSVSFFDGNNDQNDVRGCRCLCLPSNGHT